MYKARTTVKEKGEFNNIWVEGDIIHSGGKVYIHPVNNVVNVQKEIGKNIILHEVQSDTVCKSTECPDISGQMIYQGDRLEVHQGTQVLALDMIVKYGKYRAYCPADKEYMDNIGFYVETEGYPPMPLGPTAEYAKVIGNIFDTPKSENQNIEAVNSNGQ